MKSNYCDPATLRVTDINSVNARVASTPPTRLPHALIRRPVDAPGSPASVATLRPQRCWNTLTTVGPESPNSSSHTACRTSNAPRIEAPHGLPDHQNHRLSLKCIKFCVKFSPHFCRIGFCRMNSCVPIPAPCGSTLPASLERRRVSSGSRTKFPAAS